ncbi:MFS transporter [Candidatus Marsarchaeota G2 archaeon OSP_D]|jgi:Arabinose efflux permease|uniref:MFS transporter n=1 Tax=Candidatus Marsarchaeota G2 archaeon OSP_D TaxID=1978157 RepID=A0A2R6AZM5_9ARCH|nr:MAG: MFS transporter [Candidatus Marsarchaeota G2 archaeon OSP_D]
MNTRSALLVVVLGTLMAAVDTTIVILALPTIAGSLHADLAITIWTLLAYLLVAAVLATQMGRVGDIYGRSRIYIAGFILFTVASMMCGASPNIYFLIGSRLIQGLGGAMLIGNASAIVSDVFPREVRGRAFGYTTLGWNSGATLGIVLGGVLTTYLGWRYIFYINGPIGLGAVILGLKSIRDTNRVNTKLDVPGGLILGVILAVEAYASTQIAASGLASLDEALVALGVILIPLFIYVERRHSSPIIDTRVFGQRILAASIGASFLQSMGYLSVAFLLIMYLQGVRGLTPFQASLLLVPGYVLSSFIAPYMGRLTDRHGARIMATLGIALMMGALGVYLTLGVSTPLTTVVLASVISGVGSAVFYPANNTAIMGNSPPGYYGSVSGLARTLGNVGTLLSYLIAISVASLSVSRRVAFEVFLGTQDLVGDVSAKFVAGIHTAFLAAMSILVAALILSALRGEEPRLKRRGQGSASEAESKEYREKEDVVTQV